MSFWNSGCSLFLAVNNANLNEAVWMKFNKKFFKYIQGAFICF